ncbi:MAG: AMP-binding protein [Actinomycetaceae bacterium]|nr:AMP-binding protein [Actinomycetaceae bacterium]MDU0970784.1 AMP-binding protein [Actinomycetaceae bacterium]
MAASARADYSAARLLLNAAQRRPDRVALVGIRQAGARSWTTRQVVEDVAKCASWLRAQGVGPAQRVVCCAPNDPLHLVMALACQWIGAVFVPLPALAADPELRAMLDAAAPRVVVTDRVAQVAGAYSLAAAEAAIAQAAPLDTAPVRLADDLAAMVFTSGSSGEPKGVCLSAAGLWWAGQSFRTGFDYAVASQVEMVVAPLSHIGGLNGTTLDILANGGRVVVLDRFRPGQVLRTIEDYGVTIGFVVPTMLRALIAHPDWSRTDLSSWARPLVGGDALTPHLAQQLAEVGLAPIHVWGMTETGGAGACLTPTVAGPRPGSVGTPFPHVDLAILDDEGAVITAPDTLGRVWVGGPGTLEGYWRAGRVEPPRWRDVEGVAMFDTADMGSWDAQGYLRIAGRAERMIQTGGEMVAPHQVEAALSALDTVAEAAVVGIPDDYWGHVVVAVCVPAGPMPTLDEVRGALSQVLAPWKLPRALVEVDRLPPGPNGKVDHARVTEIARRAAGSVE